MKAAPKNPEPTPVRAPQSSGAKTALVMVIILIIIAGGIYTWQNMLAQEKEGEIERLQQQVSNLNGQLGQLQNQNSELNTQVTEIQEEKDRQKKIDDITAAIGDLFVNKYNEDISELTVNIEKDAPEHVYGGFKLSFDPDVAGGYFFATVIEGKWKIVLSGNGAIPCELLAHYNFPDEMKDQCVSVGDDWESYQE